MGLTHKPFRHCLQSIASSDVGHYADDGAIYRSACVSLPLSRGEVSEIDKRSAPAMTGAE